MLRKSLTKITGTSFHCSRSFASKGPNRSDTEWWNKPVNELKASNLYETSSDSLAKQVSVIPVIGGDNLPSKVVSMANSSSSSGMSFSDYKETPCSEKKFSPCAEKKEKPKSSNRPKKKNGDCHESHSSSKSSTSTSNCAHHSSLVPPACELQKLKFFDLKSNCTSFHLKTEN